MRESKIEDKVCSYAKENGWLTYKFSSPSNAGVPDRILIKDGRVVFIEFKAANEKPRKLQVLTMDKIKAHGGEVYVVDDIELGKQLIDQLDE